LLFTRPIADFKEKEQSAIAAALDILKDMGIKVIFQIQYPSKFAIMDQKILWYGSINLLSFGNQRKHYEA
jgi:hypothetical protein